MIYKKCLFFLPLLMIFSLASTAQTVNKFTKEVNNLVAKTNAIWNPEKETIVFTGSSSIRMWKNLQDLFPEQQILNTGFGGSEATDLLYFLDELVLSYQPKKVFIYEGDNDLWAKKKPSEIIKTTKEIIHTIHNKNPNTQVILISAKPSISRWRIRNKYKRLNRQMKDLAIDNNNIAFVDVWKPMLHGSKLNTKLFIEDGLHMNQTGYDIWYKTMKNLITQSKN